ncbi:PREDICTED: protein FAM180A [Nanorana parkeri]|uniref:protein FAM180A n=1 Tax=Nanorana parkeri TaxID=125878 RepID=UPI0008540DF7|nr:PREDICTED: protein FAM180A [Nanorana parkeri]
MYLLPCLLVLLFYNYVEANFTSRWQLVVFFPSAHRVRRSSPQFLDPVLQKSMPEVELLYEFLSTGVQIDPDSRMTLRDPELSSLRKATTFDVVCNDVIPKAISDIRRLGDQLSMVRGPLKREDFERTVLTMAYTALKTSKSDNENQRRIWMESLNKLFVALKRDLMSLYNMYDKEGQQ